MLMRLNLKVAGSNPAPATNQPNPTIPWADPGDADLDKNFAGAGIGTGNVLELHYLGRAQLMDAPSPHRRVNLVS